MTCLVIENMTADDSGKYVVSVENSLGADCSFASVAVEGTSVCLQGQGFRGRLYTVSRGECARLRENVP